MDTSKELKKFDRVAFRHTFLDGVSEIVLGLFLMLAAVLVHRKPSMLMVFIISFAFLSIPVVRSVQRRFTHPRIGYVEPLQEKPKQFLGMALFFIAVIGATLAIATLAGRDIALVSQSYPAVAGFLCAGGLWYTASRSGLVRFYMHAGLSIALGLALEVFTDGSFHSLRYYFAVMGGYLFLVGLIIFVRFLHRYPVHVPEVNDV